MSDVLLTPTAIPEERGESFVASSKVRYWLNILSSPLWICFVVTVLVRAWFIVHTHNVLDGDEATVGLQAEHILRGEFPVYYYGQAYLGSLQAYVIAFLFLFTGPTVWAMRIEPILTSLFIVYLTWHFSARLADAAQLLPRAKKLFMTIAAIVAACAPIYDVVEEMRVTGGYIEAFAVMLWLLLCAFRLRQRWQENASRRELLWRWAGLGFLIGLALWIDPLVMYAYATIALWLGGYFLLQLRKRYQQAGLLACRKWCKEVLPGIIALPTALLGFAPGLIWGAQHNWRNITYLFQNTGGLSLARLISIARVQKVYVTCLAPRAMGSTLPTQPDVTPANPHILTFGLIIVGCALAISAASCIPSRFSRQAVWTRLRQLTLLPLLFFACTSLIFCFASISTAAIYSGCGPVDYAGRYVTALVIALPFFVAAALIIPMLILQEKKQELAQSTNVQSSFKVTIGRPSSLRLMQVGLLLVLVLYCCTQGMAYAQADSDATFNPTGCVASNPIDIGPTISYLQRAHIQYAWASSWVGNRVTFETNEAIIATDWTGRVPANGLKVLHSDRPSILFLTRHTNLHPVFLQTLDANHVTYHVERLFSAPGIDLMVVTPLNQNVYLLDPKYASQLHQLLIGCLWNE